MDNASDGDKKLRWGICGRDLNAQPCPHSLAVFWQNPAFQKKPHAQKGKISDVHALSLHSRLIPFEVFVQIDKLLEQALQAMTEGKETPMILTPFDVRCYPEPSQC